MRRLLVFAMLVTAGAASPIAAAPSTAAETTPGPGSGNPGGPPPAIDPRSFDHDQTAMPLIGAHRSVACAACHPGGRYRTGAARPAACDSAGCHTNPHAGHLFGLRDCAACHSPSLTSMTQIHFDHEARFALGRHDQIGCYDCHTKARGTQSADLQCERCHAAASHHGDRFRAFGTPARCGTCHAATSWAPSAFNHGANTKLGLRGGHQRLACRACHRGRGPDDFEDLHGDVACKDCHAHRTVHADAEHPDGKYTTAQCLDCHLAQPEPRRPDRIVLAVHGPTGTFPLVRGHKDVPCTECHTARSKTGKPMFSALSPACGPACHEDVLHRGSLGPRCGSCHVSGVWRALAFDHDQPFPAGGRAQVAGFGLRGAHRQAACESCHPARDYVAAGATCASAACHGPDDAHAGQLGTACERCHSETGDNRFDHASAPFPLDGKHRAVPCGSCHASARFASAPRRCAGCHPVPAFHRDTRSDFAWYDGNCGGCHTTRGW